ncbi:MAG: hypothetical protein WC796_03880 [Candidatus Pacearchaeota archaeon]|jgi:hypothetical protein
MSAVDPADLIDCSVGELKDHPEHPLRVLIRQYVMEHEGYSLPIGKIRQEDLELIQVATDAGFNYFSLEKAIDCELERV